MQDFDINAAYLERKANAVLGLRGSGTLAQYSQAQGLITLESDRPEWAFPGGEYLRFGNRNAAAVAAEFSHIAFINPENSNVLVIIEMIKSQSFAEVRIPSAAQIAATLPRVQGSTSAGTDSFPRDERLNLQISPVVMESGSNAVVPWAGPYDLVQALERVFYPIILPPKSAVVMVQGVVNAAESATFIWRERYLEGKSEIK